MNRIKRHFDKNILPRLRDTKSIPDLARKINRDVSTLRKIANGVSSNPTIDIVDALDAELCQDCDFPTSFKNHIAEKEPA